MVKIISLSNEAYEKLAAIKYGKSFSEVVVELVDEAKKKEKKNLMDFHGIWRDSKKIGEIKKMLKKDRKKAKMREVTF
jgi:predicted CopG family antitoxin